MQDNTSGRENGSENDKNGTKTGQKRDRPEKVKHPKTSLEYWKTAVTFRPGVANGLYYVRLRDGLKDAWICTALSNRVEAAAVAKKHWLRMKALGSLDALLAELAPPPDPKPERICTVGELIDAARPLATEARPRIFDSYASNLRRIVAVVAGIEATEDRYGYRPGIASPWRARVDAVGLEILTTAAVAEWQKNYIARGEGHAARDSRAASARTIIRNARCLLSKRTLEELSKKVRLPSPLPFQGFATTPDTRRHSPTVKADALHDAAWHELSTTPDTLAAFLLLLLCGLRRGKADYLEWNHVGLDPDGPRVDVAVTFWWRPKTSESVRTIPMAPYVCAFFKGLREANPESDFVLQGRAPRLDAGLGEYRAEAWEPLSKWLRSKGVTARLPLHELRKMSGSFIAKIAGLEAARQHLGHRSVATTSASYHHVEAVAISLGRPTPRTP